MKTFWAAGALALAAIAFGAVQAQQPQQPAPRQGATARNLQAGKDVFAHWCASCHAANPGLAGTLALQTKYKGSKPAALEDRTDLNPDIVAYFVRNGVAWMAPFRKTEISDAELAALGAYLSAPLDKRGAHAELLAEEMVRKHGRRQ